MMKVLIVDDEFLVRELIKRSVNWDELGLQVVSEASGGMEALDVVEEHQPDIIITDICMPIMDGIEFSRRVLKKYPQIKIVVLTGHDEFDYARDSLSIGVKEYLLKPIDPSVLTKALLKLKSLIESQESRERVLEEVKPLLKEKALNELLLSKTFSPNIFNELNRLELFFTTDQFRVALLEIKSEYDFRNQALVKKTINEHFFNSEECYCFEGSRGLIVMLYHGNGDFLKSAELILNNLYNRLGISLVIGLGGGVSGLENITHSYEEAYKALEYQVVEGINSVILYSDICKTTGYDSSHQSKLLKEFSFNLNAGLEDRANESIDELFNLQVRCVGGEINSIRIMAATILSIILTLSGEQEVELFENGIQPYERVLSLNSLDKILIYLKQLTGELNGLIKNKNSQKTGKLISSVQSYVNENLRDGNMNLTSVAENFSVNSSYLSRKFKQETGENFLEYLSRAKIERAIDLLKTTDLRSYEIADEIGINDPHYFSIFFKKQLGVSISAYKKQLIVKN